MAPEGKCLESIKRGRSVCLAGGQSLSLCMRMYVCMRIRTTSETGTRGKVSLINPTILKQGICTFAGISEEG
jgi:hypothetical protein